MSMPWYGRLPERWDTHRIKNLFSLRDERNFMPLSEVRLLSLYTAIGVKPHDEIERVAGNVAVTADNYKKVYKNDIVVNIILCWQGAIGLSKWDGVTSPAYDVYRAKSDNVNVDYYNYLFRTPMFSGECYKAGRGIMAMRWRTYSDQFTAIPVPLPPHDEQDQIVRYLDWKVSQVNKLINAKRRQIALLYEQKRAVVDNEISGKRIPLKRLLLAPLQYGANDSGTVFDENLPRYVRITDITVDGKLKEDDKKSLSTDVAAPYLLQDGDILLARSGATAGKAFLYKTEYGVCAFAGYLIKASVDNQRILPEYLLFTTFGSEYDGWKKSIFIQATIQNISAERYNYFQVPLPSVNEQKFIITRLNEKIAQIDKVVATVQKEITLLTEYRTRLISDVVTGKLDVRSVVVPEYEAVEDVTVIEDESANDLTENEG